MINFNLFTRTLAATVKDTHIQLWHIQYVSYSTQQWQHMYTRIYQPSNQALFPIKPNIT